jgi:exopolyphosphatase/guanosine-5'-triphosphate,3'-diphosphate pyrophosphatase
LTERLISHDPPTSAELDAVARSAREAFTAVPPLESLRPPVGIAGTMTTMAAVSLRLVPYDGARVHGHRMTRVELERVVGHLADLDLPSRRTVAGMEPKRADVIVAGGLIALALLEHWSAEAVIVSDRGVRWGLAEEMTLEPSRSRPPPQSSAEGRR